MNPSEFHWLIDWLIDLTGLSESWQGSRLFFTMVDQIQKIVFVTLDQACAPPGTIGISMVGHVINIL